MEGSQVWFPNLIDINIKVATPVSYDLSPLNSICNFSYPNQYINFFGFNTYTLLDYIILFTSRPHNKWNTSNQTLFTRLATDWVPQNSLYLYPIMFIYQYEQYYSDDLIKLISPDLTRVVTQHINTYWVTRTLFTNAVPICDTIVHAIVALYSKAPGLTSFVLSLPIWVGALVLLLNFTLLVLTKLLPFSLVRVYNQTYKICANLASNFEFFIFTLSSILLYILMLLLASDDISEQVSDLLTSYYLILFTYLILMLVVLYSIHIFTFLALSMYSKRSVLVVILQFKNDILDLLSLILRFYVLLFRLNVYDLLEDLFDGYYIFLGDFGDEYLLDNASLPINSFEGFSLGNLDENFTFEDTDSTI